MFELSQNQRDIQNAAKRLARDNNFLRRNAEGNEPFHNLVELRRSPRGIPPGRPHRTSEH